MAVSESRDVKAASQAAFRVCGIYERQSISGACTW